MRTSENEVVPQDNTLIGPCYGPVLITDEEGSWFETMMSDARGYFHWESLSAGKYVIGINLPGEPTWKPFIEPDRRSYRIRLSEKTHDVPCDAVCNF